MLIKILKGEELFSEQGTHICNEQGIAIVASEDIDCEVNERIDIVRELLKASRLNRGLDENGDPIPVEIPQQPVIE